MGTHTNGEGDRVRHNKPFGFGRSLLEWLIKIGWPHGFLRLLCVYRQRQALFPVCLRVWKFLSFFTFKVWVLSWFSDRKYPPQALVMTGCFPTAGGAGSILEGPRNFRVWYLIAGGSMDLKVILDPCPVPQSSAFYPPRGEHSSLHAVLIQCIGPRNPGASPLKP